MNCFLFQNWKKRVKWLISRNFDSNLAFFRAFETKKGSTFPLRTHVFHDLPEDLRGLGVDVPLVDQVEEHLVQVPDQGVRLLHPVDADDDGPGELDQHQEAHGDHAEEEAAAAVLQKGGPRRKI